jgi:hypothetical protein
MNVLLMTHTSLENRVENDMNIVSQLTDREYGCSLSESISKFINAGVDSERWYGDPFSSTRYATLFAFKNFLYFRYEYPESDESWHYFTQYERRYLSSRSGMDLIDMLIYENSTYLLESFGDTYQEIQQNFKMWMYGDWQLNNEDSDNDLDEEDEDSDSIY